MFSFGDHTSRRKLGLLKGHLEPLKKLVIFLHPCIWSIRSNVTSHAPAGLNAKFTEDPIATFRRVGGTGRSMMVLATGVF